MLISSISNAKVANKTQLKGGFYPNTSLKPTYDTFSSVSDLEKLKNPEILYKFYCGEKTSIDPKILDDEETILKLVSDEDFMKASRAALRRYCMDKISDFDTDEKQKNELEMLDGIMELGDRLDLSAQKERDYELKPSFQPAFCSTFRLGFFEPGVSKRDKAEVCVNRCATSAAGVAALLAQTLVGDTVALTAITRKMCKEICKIYRMPASTVSAVLAVGLGSIAGENLSSVALKAIPGVGNLANATITYTLHEFTGRALISFCEKNYYNREELRACDAVTKYALEMKGLLDIINNEQLRNLVNKGIDKAVAAAIREFGD